RHEGRAAEKLPPARLRPRRASKSLPTEQPARSASKGSASGAHDKPESKGRRASAILIALRSSIRSATSHARRIDVTRLDQTFNKLDYPLRSIENASMKKLVSLVCVSFMGMCAVGNLRAETQPADAERYGPYPTNY